MSANEPAAEAEELLSRLIRFNTVNPPGAEREAQEYLADHLQRAGFECELLGAEPGRPNLLARLRADGAASASEGPTLCYLGHVDTVLANPEEWTRDPWSGEIAEGFLWGRGALDMKSQVAAEIAAAASLARSGWRPARGELLIVAVVDEETGGELGAQWITQNHPEKVRCDLLINEGGGAVFEYGGSSGSNSNAPGASSPDSSRSLSRLARSGSPASWRSGGRASHARASATTACASGWCAASRNISRRSIRNPRSRPPVCSRPG